MSKLRSGIMATVLVSWRRVIVQRHPSVTMEYWSSRLRCRPIIGAVKERRVERKTNPGNKSEEKEEHQEERRRGIWKINIWSRR